MNENRWEKQRHYVYTRNYNCTSNRQEPNRAVIECNDCKASSTLSTWWSIGKFLDEHHHHSCWITYTSGG